MRQEENNKPHTCYLILPDQEVSFQISVTRSDDEINVSPVLSFGIKSEDLTDDARESVCDWAKEEAIRVALPAEHN